MIGKMPFLHHSFARRILLNSLIIWVGLRLATIVVGWGLRTSFLLAIVLVSMTAVLAVFDARRRSRNLLLENLGVSWVPVALWAAFPPIALESCWLLFGGR